jgi:C-terminal processing protease CtpA/Prc
MKIRKYLFALLAGCAAWTALPAQNKLLDSPSRKLQLAEFAISNLYVDKVDEDKLVETAIVSMLEELDPHSTYSDPEEVKRLNEPLQGNFDGIGIQFNMATDTLFVIQPVSGGPSEKVGILAGDRIIEVNDTVIAGVKMNTDEVMRRLRGPKGSTVTVKVLRAGVGVSVSIPIFSNRQNKSAVEKAVLNEKTAKLNMQDTEKSLLTEIESVYQNALSAQSQYQAASEKVKALETSYNLIEQQFGLGMKNTLELLTEKNSLLSARQSQMQAKYLSIANMQILNLYQDIPVDIK